MPVTNALSSLAKCRMDCATLCGNTEPPHRMARQRGFPGRVGVHGTRHRAGEQRRIDRTRQDCVAAYAGCCVIQRDRLRQRHHGALRRDVGRVVAAARAGQLAAMVTMLPFPARTIGPRQARTHTNVPVTLTAITAFQSAINVSPKGLPREIPAAVTRASDLAQRRDRLFGPPPHPSRRQSAPGSPRAPLLHVDRQHLRPLGQNRLAAAQPIPEAAPVTTATFPCMRIRMRLRASGGNGRNCCCGTRPCTRQRFAPGISPGSPRCCSPADNRSACRNRGERSTGWRSGHGPPC